MCSKSRKLRAPIFPSVPRSWARITTVGLPIYGVSFLATLVFSTHSEVPRVHVDVLPDIYNPPPTFPALRFLTLSSTLPTCLFPRNPWTEAFKSTRCFTICGAHRSTEHEPPSLPRCLISRLPNPRRVHWCLGSMRRNVATLLHRVHGCDVL